MRQPGHGDFGHRGVQRQAAFDLHRRDVLAAGDDHVVDPAGDEQIAVGVDQSGVAGKIPAAANGGGVGIGTAPIALERFVAGDQRDDLAFLAGGGDLVGGFGAETDHADQLVDAGAPGGAGLGGGVLLDGEGVDLGAAVMVDEQVGAKRRVELLEQRVGHRRAGEAELAHRADVGAGKQRMMHEIVVQRRHQIEIGDPLGGDQLQRARGIELRQADERAADQRHRQQRTNAHGVVERHDAERAFAAAVEVLRHMGDRRGALGEMPPRHAFRPRCRARGVEHQRPGVGAHARRGVGGFGLHEAGEVEVRRAGHRDGDARQALGLLAAATAAAETS